MKADKQSEALHEIHMQWRRRGGKMQELCEGVISRGHFWACLNDKSEITYDKVSRLAQRAGLELVIREPLI